MPEINLKIKRSFLHLYFFISKKYLWIISLLLLYLAGTFAQKGLGLLNHFKIQPADLLGFFGQPKESLVERGGVTNFLVLGIRGEGSDSPNLTDSINFFSYNQNSKQLTQIGIPRDLWVTSLQDKINTAYHYGEVASPGAGIKLAEASILETIGQPVDYTVVINFNLFQQTIDLVGGLDINVNPGFEDKEYPLQGKENSMPISSRYETVTFKEGLNHLDGKLALKYVRSRHSLGDEGTDFARSRRQQQVVSELKEKIFSKEFLLNKLKLEQLLNLSEQNLKTNITSNLYPILARIGLEQSGKNIKSISLSTTPDKDGVTILSNPPLAKYKGKWVLIPKDNNWKVLKQYVDFHLAN